METNLSMCTYLTAVFTVCREKSILLCFEGFALYFDDDILIIL